VRRTCPICVAAPCDKHRQSEISKQREMTSPIYAASLPETHQEIWISGSSALVRIAAGRQNENSKMRDGSISRRREAANYRVLSGWGSPPSCQMKLNGDTIRPTASLLRASRLPQHAYVRLRGAGVSRNCEVVPAKICYEHHFNAILP
jgi:hypothetical protein